VGVGSTTVGFAAACNGCLYDSVEFVVDDSDFIYPVTVDARPVSGVTLKVTESSLALFGSTTADFEIKGAKLVAEGDSVAIVANLVLSDASRMPLTAATGLSLVSRDPTSIAIEDLRIGVPIGAENANGPLALAVWQPINHTCPQGVLAAGNITLEVQLPPAIGATV